MFVAKEKNEETGKTSFVYFVLVQDNELGEKRLDEELIRKYECTLRGEKPKHLRKLDKLFGICSCMHKIRTVESDDPWKVPESPWNPAKLDCFTCKGFKDHGICAHVYSPRYTSRQYRPRYTWRYTYIARCLLPAISPTVSRITIQLAI